MLNLKKDFELFAKSRGISKEMLDAYIEPTIIEQHTMHGTSLSVFSRLLMDRIVFLGTEINSDVANIISAQLLWLDSIDSGKDITMHCSSPGGSVYAGYQILDSMDFMKTTVWRPHTSGWGGNTVIPF